MSAGADGRDIEPWSKGRDVHGWPSPDDAADGGDYAKELYEAKLEVRKKRTDQAIARAQAETDLDLAIEQEYYKALLEVDKGSLERVRASADTVQRAAGVIVTLYTGILALAFSVAERPLPLRAIFAALLLGAAVALSTAFLAYLPSPQSSGGPRPGGGPQGGAIGPAATSSFNAWIRAGALRNHRMLRAGVVALGLSLAFLPAPFVAFEREAASGDLPAWGTAPAVRADDVELQKILYAAQIAELADQRKRPLADDEYRWLWTVLFVVAGAVVLAVWRPGLPRRRAARGGAGRDVGPQRARRGVGA